MAWLIERLDGSRHDVSAFDCGEPSLNTFLKKHAAANDRADLGRTFVAVEPGNAPVAGYFTVAAGSVRFDAIPDRLAKRLPKYPIPTVHVGRLAVARKFQGRGLGETLLVESLRKGATAAEVIAAHVIDLIALSDNAKRFYARYGFTEMLDDPKHLFLPMATARVVAGIVGKP
jgi:ribosomal protein S18 acetylase RimI-like enzyme